MAKKQPWEAWEDGYLNANVPPIPPITIEQRYQEFADHVNIQGLNEQIATNDFISKDINKYTTKGIESLIRQAKSSNQIINIEFIGTFGYGVPMFDEKSIRAAGSNMSKEIILLQPSNADGGSGPGINSTSIKREMERYISWFETSFHNQPIPYANKRIYDSYQKTLEYGSGDPLKSMFAGFFNTGSDGGTVRGQDGRYHHVARLPKSGATGYSAPDGFFFNYYIITIGPSKKQGKRGPAQVRIPEEKVKEVKTSVRKNNWETQKDKALYLKPAFFLSDMIPYVDAYINVPYGDSYVKFNLTYINDPSAQQIDSTLQNLCIIKDFSFQSLNESEGGNNVKLTIIDPYEDVISLLALRLGAIEKLSGFVIMTIKFGWKVPAKLEKDLANVTKFSHSMSCNLTKFDFEFNPQGGMEGTLIFTTQGDSVIVGNNGETIDEFSAYSVLGANPALELMFSSMLETFHTIMGDKLTKKTSINSKPQINDSVVNNICDFLMFNSIKDLPYIKNFIKVILEYYSLTDADLREAIQIPQKELNNTLETLIKTAKLKQNIYKDKKTIGDYFYTTIYQKVFETNITSGDLNGNLFTELNKLQERKEISFLKGISADTIRKAKSNYFNVMVYICQNSLIHPYLVWQYVRKKSIKKGMFGRTSEQTQEILQKLDSNNSDRIPHFLEINYFEGEQLPERIYPIGFFPKNKTRIENGKTIKLPEIDIANAFNIKEKDKGKWLYVVKEFNVSPTDSWTSAINNILNKIYVQVSIKGSNDEQINTIRLLKDEAKAEDKGSEIIESKDKVVTMPAKLRFKVIQCKGDIALQKVSEYLNIKYSDKIQNGLKNRPGYKLTFKNFANDNELNTVEYLAVNAGSLYQRNVYIFLYDIFDDIAGSRAGKTDIAASNAMLLQSFSYRARKFDYMMNEFNPGFPTAFDINFPDILDVSIKNRAGSWFDNTIRNVLDYKVNGISMNNGSSVVQKDVVALCEQMTKNKVELDTKQKELDKEQKKGKNKDLSVVKKIQEDIRMLEENNEKIERMMNEDSTSIDVINVNADNPKEYPISYDLNFRRPNIFSGNAYDAIRMKKEMQDFRRNIILEPKGITISMSFLGDPCFGDASTIGKYIFFKMYGADGELNILTGKYVIFSYGHSISGGVFTTTADVQIDTQGFDKDFLERLNKEAYEKDSLNLYQF